MSKKSSLKQKCKQNIRKWLKSEFIHCDKTQITVEDIKDAQSVLLARLTIE